MQYVLHMFKMKSNSSFYSTTHALVCLLLSCIPQCIFCIENVKLSKAFTNIPFYKVRHFKHVVEQNMDEWSHYFSSPLQDVNSNLTLHITCNVQGRFSPGLFVNSNVHMCDDTCACFYVCSSWQKSGVSLQCFHGMYVLIHVTSECNSWENTFFKMGMMETQVWVT